jgi:hypothetical protein
MKAQACVEPNLNRVLETGLSFIPSSSSVFRLVNEIRDRRINEPDWHKARAWIANRYGYDKYPGNCHVIPNHALIHLALLYGVDDFQKSLMIVNTSGRDTDSNSGNVGCLLGIKNGLEGIAPRWTGAARLSTVSVCRTQTAARPLATPPALHIPSLTLDVLYQESQKYPERRGAFSLRASQLSNGFPTGR